MWLINNDVKLIRKLINWYKEVRIEWKSVKRFTYFFIYNFIYIINNNSFSYKLLNFIY